jgi:serine/threonine-protein kinase
VAANEKTATPPAGEREASPPVARDAEDDGDERDEKRRAPKRRGKDDDRATSARADAEKAKDRERAEKLQKEREAAEREKAKVESEPKDGERAPPPTTTPPPPKDETTPKRAVEEGLLTLETVPWTTVFLGGKKLGDTPLIGMKVPAGEITLLLVNDVEGIRQEYVVVVRPGQTTKKRLGLK